MGHETPARYHENVARAPLEYSVADPGAALALNRHEDGCVGRAIACARKTLWQKLNKSGHGRHREVARHRIGVAKLEAVAGVPFLLQLHLFERAPGLRVGIVEDR